MKEELKQFSPKSRKNPIYMHIYKTLYDEIEKKVYSSDNLLPSENKLCERFDVERNTVRKALKILVDDGIVIRIPGCGTKIVTEEEKAAAAQKKAEVDHCILLVTQEDYLQGTDNEYFHLKLIKSFENIFSDLKYSLIVKFIKREIDLRNVILHVSPSVIIFDSYNQTSIYQEAIRAGIPCISINHYTPLMTSFVSNNFDGAYRVIKMLTEAGHKKIAFITGKRNYQTTIERLSSIQEFYMRQGIALDEKYIFTGDWKFASGVKIGEEILSLPQDKRPTAVFAFNDDMAFGCLSCFEKHGIAVPEDISIVGFDNTDRYQSIFRPITTVDVNIDALVEYACWYLSGCISNTVPSTHVKIDIDVTIVDHGTIKQL